MDRRNALVMLSGVVAGSALLTVPRPVVAQMMNRTMAGSTLSETQYKAMTLVAGTLAKQTSQLALTQAASPKVKQFAQFEVNEQTTVAQVLTNTVNPPPAPLDPSRTAILQQLQAQQPGKTFDMAYLQGQIAGHQELMGIQQAFLNGRPSNRDVVHVAMMSRTTTETHLTILQDLMNQLATS